MKKLRNYMSLAMAAAMLMSLCACGSAASPSGYKAAAGDSSYAMTEEAYYEAPAAYSSAASYDYETADVAENGFASSEADLTGAGSTGSATDLRPEKIIYSANATLETTEFDTAIAALDKLVESYGGFIEASSISDNSYYSKARGYTGGRNASYTIRIPGSVFTEVMGKLTTLGNVPYSNTYTENVTSQYYDTQARLQAYEAQEQRLIELMAQAETIEDIIKIEDRLTEVRYCIDSLQSSLNNYDRKVAYSTIYLSVEEVEVYTQTETIKHSFGEKLGQAAKDGLRSVVDFLEELVLWLTEALPTLVILGALGALVAAVIKRIRKGSKARGMRRAAKRNAKLGLSNQPETAEAQTEEADK